LFPNIKSVLEVTNISETEDKRMYDGTESYSTTEVTRNVSDSGSIVGLSA